MNVLSRKMVRSNGRLVHAISRHWIFFMGPYQVTGLCQRSSNVKRPQRQHPTRKCQRSGRNVCQSCGKLGPKIDRCKRARRGHITDIEFHS